MNEYMEVWWGGWGRGSSCSRTTSVSPLDRDKDSGP